MSRLAFAAVGVRIEPYAAVPTLTFRLRVTEATHLRVHTIALRTQIQIEPRQRPYDDAEKRRLLELFGEPERWGTTLQTVLWTHSAQMVSGFEDNIEFDMPVPCSYDFDVAAAKYFHALDDGHVPLMFLFSGTLFVRGEQEVQVERVAWNLEARFRLPVALWRNMMDAYYPNSAWLRLGRDAFDALQHYKATRALFSLDEAVLSAVKGGQP